MPEVAEVKIRGDRLRECLLGDKVMEIKIEGGVYKEKEPKGWEEIKERLRKGGLKVLKVNTKGKFLWIEFEEDWSCWIHFGMSGNIVLKKSIYTCFSIKTDYGITIYYEQQGSMGESWEFNNNKNDLIEKLNGLGPDILSGDQLTDKEILDRFNLCKKKNITGALLDQSIFSGIGNYLKSETLYLCKIHPFCRVLDLDDSLKLSLYHHARKLSKQIYDLLSVSIFSDDNHYRNMKFSLFSVYDRNFDPNGFPISKVKKYGRYTHWCPSIQTLPFVYQE